MRTQRAIVNKTKRDRIRNDDIRQITGFTSIRSKNRKGTAKVTWTHRKNG